MGFDSILMAQPLVEDLQSMLSVHYGSVVMAVEAFKATDEEAAQQYVTDGMIRLRQGNAHVPEAFVVKSDSFLVVL